MIARILGWLRRPAVSLGERGERAAARFLRRAGYTILARRYRQQTGEIDLIVTEGRRVIFVEVKTRRSAAIIQFPNSLRLNYPLHSNRRKLRLGCK